MLVDFTPSPQTLHSREVFVDFKKAISEKEWEALFHETRETPNNNKIDLAVEPSVNT